MAKNYDMMVKQYTLFRVWTAAGHNGLSPGTA